MAYWSHRRRFRDLSEQEIIALAISSEEDDGRIYRSYAEYLRADYPQTAAIFDEMAEEEDTHRQELIRLHQARFGNVIPLIRREHVAGFYARKPVWLSKQLSLESIRAEAAAMERNAEQFYLRAAAHTSDAATRKLLGDLAAAESGHTRSAEGMMQDHLQSDAAETEELTAKRQSARVGGAHGWIRIHLGADICDGFRDPRHVDHVPSGLGRLCRGRYFDGIYRSGLR